MIDQGDIFTYVFTPIDEQHSLDYKYMAGLLLEYIKSLLQTGVKVHHYIYEFLIDLLVKNNAFYQLHQFLQYHVVTDSLHVACQLISLEPYYKPAFQLALDMLKRLLVNDDILEVLLARKQVMAALRFVKNHRVSSVPSNRFLEVALECNDDIIFYTVYKYLELRNEITRGAPDFLPEEGCSSFVELFNLRFGIDALASAQREDRSL